MPISVFDLIYLRALLILIASTPGFRCDAQNLNKITDMTEQLEFSQFPPGGDGYYYLSTYLLGDDREVNGFDIEINGVVQCTVRVEQEDDINDYPQASCSAAIFAAGGIFVAVVTE